MPLRTRKVRFTKLLVVDVLEKIANQSQILTQAIL